MAELAFLRVTLAEAIDTTFGVEKPGHSGQHKRRGEPAAAARVLHARRNAHDRDGMRSRRRAAARGGLRFGRHGPFEKPKDARAQRLERPRRIRRRRAALTATVDVIATTGGCGGGPARGVVSYGSACVGGAPKSWRAVSSSIAHQPRKSGGATARVLLSTQYLL